MNDTLKGNAVTEDEQQELEQLRKQLTIVQTECTRLLLENRELRNVLKIIPSDEVRKRRIAHGLTLQELSAATGIAHGDISLIERGMKPLWPQWRTRINAVLGQ